MAYHLHWSLDEILVMEHQERHTWIEHVSKINKQINEASGGTESSTESSNPFSAFDGFDGTEDF